MKYFGIVFLATCIISCSTAQPSYYNTSDKKAKKYLAAADECMRVTATKMYPDLDCAIANTEKALERDPDCTDAMVKMSEYYDRKGDKKNAIIYLNKVLNKDPNYSQTGLLYYHVASLEMSEGQYEACLKHSKRYLEFRNNNEELAAKCNRFIENCRFAMKAMQNPVPFEPKNLGPGVNTQHPEYFPALTGDDNMLLFTRVIPDARIPKSIGGKQEDFYVSEKENGVWTTAYGVSPKINSKYNEGAPTLSTDGRLLIFTACEFMNEGYGPSRVGKGSCDLFYSFKVGGVWTKPENFGAPMNSWSWESQPSFSSDGKTIYFVRGIREKRVRRDLQKQDIYYSEFDEKTGWSAPKKLGPNINTPYREESVYIHPDGQTLYFSSEGHPGMGGLDIYVSRKQPDGTWGEAVNLGYPINTHENENSLLVGANGEIAYFASDREGGYGGLDLYGFELYEAGRPVFTTYVKGKVYDAKTKAPLEASFKLIDLSTGDTVISSRSDHKTGEFLVSIPTNKDYALFADKPGYLFFSENFSLSGENLKKNFAFDVPLSKNGGVLENVFFDKDKATLKPESKFELDKLVRYLDMNKDLNITLEGHTDSDGDDDYNMKLSQDRAEAVMNYLIENGIDAKRLKAKGYGETKPRDTNDTVEGRANNRRTEYKMTK